jgi:hypothetical protein
VCKTNVQHNQEKWGKKVIIVTAAHDLWSLEKKREWAHIDDAYDEKVNQK